MGKIHKCISVYQITLASSLSDISNCALKDGKQQSCGQAEEPWNAWAAILCLSYLVSISIGVDTLNFAAWVGNFSIGLASSSFGFSPRSYGKTGMNFFGQPSICCWPLPSTELPQRGSPVSGGVALTLYERWQICLLSSFRCLAVC